MLTVRCHYPHQTPDANPNSCSVQRARFAARALLCGRFPGFNPLLFWLSGMWRSALFCDVTLRGLVVRLRLKCDGTRAKIRFRLSGKRTSSFKSSGASVQSTTGSRRVRISGSNAGYTMFRGSVKSTGYPLHSPVSPSLPLLCVTVCHHVSTGLYQRFGTT